MGNNINLKNIPNQALQVLEVIEELFESQLIGMYIYIYIWFSYTWRSAY